MPSSLIIVALVVAWLLVLVPIVARRRQEVARTADSTLAARVVRSGGVRSRVEEEHTMPDAGESDTERAEALERELDRELDELDELDALDADDEALTEDEDHYDDTDADSVEYAAHVEYTEVEYTEQDRYQEEYAEYDEYREEYRERRPYRPGRGGFDPEAAAITARARYAFRQRVVVLMLLAAVVTGLLAGLTMPVLWWAHAVIDVSLVGYLGYLRRQVRIEEEIRERRTARLGGGRASADELAEPEVAEYEDDYAVDELDELDQDVAPVEPAPTWTRQPIGRQPHRPGTVVVDTDDEDPAFAELDEPGALPYRRAVGE